MPQFTPAQVGLAQAGDEAALACVLAHMMPMIRSSAAGCIGPGMELEDAVQEGIIGLFRALESYDVCRDASFETYAGACIQHAQQAAKRAACRKKHLPLNTSVPLEESTPAPGPEEQAIEQERYNSWKARMAQVVRNHTGSPFAAGKHHAGPFLVQHGFEVFREKLGAATPYRKLPCSHVDQGF